MCSLCLAVDLQNCGLSMKGGASLSALLRANQTLEVVDARNNPFVPDRVLADLTHILQGRKTEDSLQVGSQDLLITGNS